MESLLLYARMLVKTTGQLRPSNSLAVPKNSQSKSFLNFIRNQTAEQLLQMGNSYRKYSPLTQMSLHLEYPYYTSGQMVRGFIRLRTVESLSTKVLYLRLEGQERCLWYEGSSLNRRRLHGLNQFFNLEYVIHNFEKDKLMPKPEHRFPFCFDLSSNLQGTFQSYLNDKTYIRYKIKAQLIDYSYPDNSLYYEMPLEIREPFRMTQKSIQGIICTAPTGCFASGNGQTTLRMVLTKNVIYVGEYVDILITVDNTANNQPVREVKISFIQNLFVNANSGVTRTFKRTKKQLSGAGAMGRATNSYKVAVKITPDEVEDPSTIGTIVANYYTFEAEAVVGMRKFTRNCPCLSAHIWVMIQSPSSLYGQPPVPPHQVPIPPFLKGSGSMLGNPQMVGATVYDTIQVYDMTKYTFAQNQKNPAINYEPEYIS